MTWKDDDFIEINFTLDETLRLFSNRTGTSVDDGARKSNTWLDQWQSGKIEHQKSCLVLSERFPVLNWGSRA